MRALIVLLSILAAIEAFQAQSQTPQPPSVAFEVASIKPNKSGDSQLLGLGFRPGGDVFAATNVTVRDLLRAAFSRRAFDVRQFAGAPGWIDQERFDIAAKSSGALPRQPDEYIRAQASFVRSLLEGRFKLVVHTEQREVLVFALVKANRNGTLGPKLVPSTVDCAALFAARAKGEAPLTTPGKVPMCTIAPLPGHLRASAVMMSQFAGALSYNAGREVVDQTGLSGAYDIDLQWTPELGFSARDTDAGLPPPPPDAPSFFTALQQQLGLKVESQKDSIEVIVIDHVERPTED
jgi:bla regulator protein blaR1